MAATATWARAIGEDDPDKVLPLYAADGVLWGTLSQSVRSQPPAIRDYFVTAFKVLPGRKVAFGEQPIRVYGSTAVKAGVDDRRSSLLGDAATSAEVAWRSLVEPAAAVPRAIGASASPSSLPQPHG